MICGNPFIKDGQAFSCGQCLPCRIGRRRVWSHRIMLEAVQYKDNCFATLTYNDDHLPGDGSLEPKELQNFLKRLRKNYPARLRFYAVGEYGDNTQRPHYHLALFNFASCLRGRTHRDFRNRVQPEKCCPQCKLVSETWGRGDIDLGILEMSSAQYVAQYVTKKMTNWQDERLQGRHPEFARMSNRPGLGADAMHEIASELMRLGLDESQPDVPSELRHGHRKFPLGRYLQRRLRKLIGKDEACPPEILQQIKEEMSSVRQAAFDASRSFKTEVIKEGNQKRLNQESRQKLNRKGRPL